MAFKRALQLACIFIISISISQARDLQKSEVQGKDEANNYSDATAPYNKAACKHSKCYNICVWGKCKVYCWDKKHNLCYAVDALCKTANPVCRTICLGRKCIVKCWDIGIGECHLP